MDTIKSSELYSLPPAQQASHTINLIQVRLKSFITCDYLPNVHQSTGFPWPLLLRTSGARYSGVPQKEKAEWSESMFDFDKPKSAIRIYPSLSRITFSGLRLQTGGWRRHVFVETKWSTIEMLLSVDHIVFVEMLDCQHNLCCVEAGSFKVTEGIQRKALNFFVFLLTSPHRKCPYDWGYWIALHQGRSLERRKVCFRFETSSEV